MRLIIGMNKNMKKNKYKKDEKYTKKYFEIYAKKTLEYCYNNSWKNCLKNGENPDLQSKLLDIGIEVTRAQTKRDGKINSIFNKYIKKDIKYEELKKKIESLGGLVDKIGNKTLMSPTHGLIDFQNHIHDLVDSIKNKTSNKLPNYKLFSKNMLYIFTFESLFTSSDIEEAFKKAELELSKLDLRFDQYYINCIDKIFIVDRDGKLLKEVLISDENLKKIKREALDESLIDE